MNLWLRRALAVASGLLLTLVSPPLSWAWLHWVSFIPVFIAVHDLPRREAFKLGYLCGFAGVISLFSWLVSTISVFGDLPVPVAVAILVLFAAAWGLPYGLILQFLPDLRRRFGAVWVPLFACVWVLGERLQPQLFPYYQGVGQYRTPWVWQLASLIGSMGVSTLVLLVNAALAELWLSRGRRWWPAALAGGLFVANLGFGAWRHDTVSKAIATAPTLKVSLMQQGVSMVTRLSERRGDVLKSWVNFTDQVAPKRPELVIWPEGSIGYNPTDPRVEPALSRLARSGGFALLLGGGTHEGVTEADRRDWNSAYFFDASGQIAGRYDKMVPLPFGEYMPWPTSYLRPYIAGVGDFRAGETLQIFDVNGVKISTPICYEAILDRQMFDMGTGVDLYVNITNDAWFGDSAAPHQHAMLTAAETMQNGRAMVRIAYTGITMVVLPNGEITHYYAPFTDVAEVTDVPVYSMETGFRRGGWLFSWFAAGIGALAIARVWRVTSAPSAA